MPTLKIITPIEPDRYYHIYNKGNDSQRVFYEKEDYRYFIWFYLKFVPEHAHTLAYSLIPNHYHFLIKTRPFANSKKCLFGKQFGRVIQCYTSYINYKYGRTGSLFYRRFRRLMVTKQDYLKHLFYYIHTNPEKHDATNNYLRYPYSSVRSYFESFEGFANTNYGISIFGSFEDMRDFHDAKKDEYDIRKLIMEE